MRAALPVAVILLWQFPGPLRAELTLSSPVGPLELDQAGVVLELSSHFSGIADAASFVRATTSFGLLHMELLESSAPATTANFLNYVRAGAYTNSVVHRSIPGFVWQTGGYQVANNSLFPTPTDPPVVNEFGVSNTRGTVAMAKLGGDPDSATSQWFVNLGDNSANLDDQNGGFTVFAKVWDNDLATVDQIASIPAYNVTNLGQDWPLQNLQPGQQQVTFDNLVYVFAIEEGPFFALNPRADLFSASLDNGRLSIFPTGEHGLSTTLTLYGFDSTGGLVRDDFVVTAVPEPSAMLLLLGALGLMWRGACPRRTLD